MTTKQPSAPRKNAGKTRGRPFGPGNPGKPQGARHKATQAVEALLEGEAEAIGRKCIEMALEGDTTALRLVMERIAPLRRGRPVLFGMPSLKSVADLPNALSALLEEIGVGSITPEEGATIAGIIEAKCKALQTLDLENRVAALEKGAS